MFWRRSCTILYIAEESAQQTRSTISSHNFCASKSMRQLHMLICPCCQKPSSKETMQDTKMLHVAQGSQRIIGVLRWPRARSLPCQEPIQDNRTLHGSWCPSSIVGVDTQALGHVEIVVIGSTSTMTLTSSVKIVLARCSDGIEHEVGSVMDQPTRRDKSHQCYDKYTGK